MRSLSLATSDLAPRDLAAADRLAEVYAHPGTGAGGRAGFIRANMVASADGAAALDNRSGGLSSADDRRLFHVLRNLCDVVLVGAQTVRTEGYGPAKADPALAGLRQQAAMGPVPPIAVVSASLDLDPASALFAEAQARTLVLTVAAAPRERRDRLEPVADLLEVDDGHGRLDPDRLVSTLVGRGFPRILCEGGPTLLGSLVAAGRLDELCLTVAPLVVGGDALRPLRGVLPRPAWADLTGVVESEGWLFLRYRFGSPT